MRIKKLLVILFIPLFAFSVEANVLKVAGAIAKLLGIDVPVMDIFLKGEEEDWNKEEQKKWDQWKGLYKDFCNVFNGRIGQMLERNTGYGSGSGFDNLINNTENILDFMEDSLDFSDKLEGTILGMKRKEDAKNKLPKDGSQVTKDEQESLEFRKTLLEDKAQEYYKQLPAYSTEEIRNYIDERLQDRVEELDIKEGLLNLLTQVKRDEDERIPQLQKRVDELLESSKNKKVESENGENEEVTDTAELMNGLVGLAKDLSTVDEAIHKMVKMKSEKDMQKYLNRKKTRIVGAEEATGK